MAAEAPSARHRHTAEDERPAVHERMEIEPQADARHRPARARARRRSSGVVILTFSASPRTTRSSERSSATLNRSERRSANASVIVSAQIAETAKRVRAEREQATLDRAEIR